MQRKISHREKILFLYSLIFAFAYVCGSFLYGDADGVALLVRFVITFLASFVGIWLLLFLIDWIVTALSENGSKKRPVSKWFARFFLGIEKFCKWGQGLGTAILLLLSWLPCYLSYFPGYFAYDMIWQYNMAVGAWPVTTQHPPLHTFLLRLLLWVGGKVDSENALYVMTVLYAILQMTLLAFLLARLIRALAERISGVLLLASILFLMLNPCIALFSFSSSKDACFAVVFVGMMLELLEWADGKRGKGLVAKTFLLGTLCCLLRNNFVYAFVVFLVVSFFALKGKSDRKPFFFCGGAIVITVLFVTKCLYPAVGVVNQTPYEAWSVPIQQIAKAITDLELTEEEEAEVTDYLGLTPDELRERYNPRFADNIKGDLDYDAYRADPLRLWKIWAHFLVRDPGGYLAAFCQLNLPFWYQGANAIDPYAQRPYIEVSSYDMFLRANLLPKAKAYYDNIALMWDYDARGIWKWVFCLATPIWLMLGSVAACLARKNKKYIWCIGLPLLYWMTFLLGPVSSARYIFPFMVLYPLFFVLPFARTSAAKPEKIEIEDKGSIGNEETKTESKSSVTA